jgi:hypothetical protein
MRRRELLLAAAGLLAVPATARAAPTEGAVLLNLMGLEQSARSAYAAAIRTLGSAAPGALATLRSHESDHTRVLATELAAVGLGRPSAPPLAGAAAKVAGAPDRGAVLNAAITLEDQLVAAYQAALAGLPDAKVAMTAATILASHSQHRLILRLAAGQPGS